MTIISLTNCKTKTKIVEVPINNRTTIIEKLVPVTLPPDSVLLSALFECDSLYNVVLKNFSELKSKGIESNFNFSNNTLDYKTKTTPDTVYIPGKETIIEKEVPVPVPVEVEVNKLTAWQKFFIKAGQIGCGLVLLVIIFFIGKLWKSIKF